MALELKAITAQIHSVEHIIEIQDRKERAFLAEFAQGTYSPQAPLILSDPYGVNPLSALIAFRTETEEVFSLEVQGKDDSSTITKTFPKAREHFIPVLGLYPDKVNTVTLRAYQGESHSFEIQTTALPGGYTPLVSINSLHVLPNNELVYLIPAVPDYPDHYPCGMDDNGDIRWFLDLPCVFEIARLKNGNLMISSHRRMEQLYYTTGLYEMSPIGKIYKEYRLPYFYHHDFFEMADGNILALTDSGEFGHVEDACVLIDRESGDILKQWNYADAIDIQKVSGSKSWTEEDWAHNNSVFYDQVSNTLVLSARHFDGVFGLDFETGELKWMVSDPTGWPEEMLKHFFFETEGGYLGWTYGQHAARITSNGDLTVFDNHYHGAKREEDHIPSAKNYSRGVRYRLDLKNKKIHQVWQLGQDFGSEWYSPYISSLRMEEDGLVILHFGGNNRKDGISTNYAGHKVIAEGTQMNSRTLILRNGVKLLDLHTRGNFFRAQRFGLYGEGANLELGKGSVLGQLGETHQIKVSVNGKSQAQRGHLDIMDEIDRFEIWAVLPGDGDLVLKLKQAEEERYYRLARLKVTQDPNDPRLFLSLAKTGLSGPYQLSVIAGEEEFPIDLLLTVCQP